MFLYCAVVLGILIRDNKAEPHVSPAHVGSEDLKTFEIAKLIHTINEDNGREKVDPRDAFNTHQGKLQKKEPDYVGIKASNPSLGSLIALIKSLKVGGLHDFASSSNVRFHVIQNPHVLLQYKKQLVKKHGSLETSSVSKINLQHKLSKFLRRNAVFRFDKTDTQNNKLKPALRMGGPDRDRNTENSMEKNNNNVHIRHNDNNIKKDSSHVTFSYTKNDEYVRDKKPFIDSSKRMKNSYKDDKKDEWETVVQKYDKWNSNNNKDFVKKTKFSDDYRNNDKYKEESNKNEKYNNDRGRDEKYQDGTKMYNKYNDDRMGNDKYNDETKRNYKYNDEPKKTDKYHDGYNNHRLNDNDSLNKKSVKEWDEPKKSKSFNNKKDNWDEPKKTLKSKKDDNWDSSKSKSMEKRDKGRMTHKNDEWDKPLKDTMGGIYERKKDDIKSTYEKPAYKERDSGGWNKKPYVPKISEYYNPRPRIQEHAERPGFKPFGRTSIPFVGKKGIYEEEVAK